jgi:hypothetical protein
MGVFAEREGSVREAKTGAVVATLPMSACGFKIYLYDEALVRWRSKVLFDSTVLMVLTSQLARLTR